MFVQAIIRKSSSKLSLQHTYVRIWITKQSVSDELQIQVGKYAGTFLSNFYFPKRFGDHSARIITSVVLSNYFNQKERLGRELSDVKGVVFVFDRRALHLDTLALCSLWMHKECTIICPIGTYTILQLSQVPIFFYQHWKPSYSLARKLEVQLYFMMENSENAMLMQKKLPRKIILLI